MKMKVCKHVRKRTTGNFHSSMKMDADIRVHANPAKKKPCCNRVDKQGSEPTAFKGLINYCKYSEVVYDFFKNNLTEQLQ